MPKTKWGGVMEVIGGVMKKEKEREIDGIVRKCGKCGRENAEMGCWNSTCDANEYYIRSDIGFQL